jgi:ABC-2 type transport system ATP-binding protein
LPGNKRNADAHMKSSGAFTISVKNLTRRYGDIEVLRGISLGIREGELYALMGPNGSGKTTLTSIIASVRLPTSGSIEVCGKSPEEAKKLMAYIPQDNFSSSLLSGSENLMYFAGLLGYKRAEAKKLTESILKIVGLSKDAEKRVAQYSGGMRKRLEVATALFPSTRVLLLDEPTTGLDPSARKNLLGMLKELLSEGATILLTTHIGADAEAASRVGLMENGRIIAEGEPDKLIEESGLASVINIETAIKSEKVASVLRTFSNDEKLLETDVGYRVYSKHTQEATPDIVRGLDKIGCRTSKIESVRPTLEDVFFKLTEKPLQSGESS